MPLEKKVHNLSANTRLNARKEIVRLFLEENYGTGTRELSSKYEYIVEKYDSYKIILKRPAVLNKGFDFVVHIDGMYFKGNKKHSNPSHDDIIKTLCQLKTDSICTIYKKIKIEINNIFELKDFHISNVETINFLDYENIERPIIILLLAIKWLFIEQDITYWNWSGRAMLMNALKAKQLA